VRSRESGPAAIRLLGFHDGTPVTARDCVASIRRWAARSVPGQAMMEQLREWNLQFESPVFQRRVHEI
jgi:hypothetical protein